MTAICLIISFSFLERSAAAGSGDDSNKTRQIIKIAGIIVGSGALLVGLAIFVAWKRRKSRSAQGILIEHRGN